MLKGMDNPFTMQEKDWNNYGVYLISDNVMVTMSHTKKMKTWDIEMTQVLSRDEKGLIAEQKKTIVARPKTFDKAKEELMFELKFLKRLFYENDIEVYNHEYDHYDD